MFSFRNTFFTLRTLALGAVARHGRTVCADAIDAKPATATAATKILFMCNSPEQRLRKGSPCRGQHAGLGAIPEIFFSHSNDRME